MKKYFWILLIGLTWYGCTETASEGEMDLTGEISELKKGVLLLQRVNDTLLETIDSVEISGDPTFQFITPVESPEVFYLYLKKDGSIWEDRIAFFAEPKPIQIRSSLKNFGLDVSITGSVNQEKMDEYALLIKRYTDRNLDLIESIFKAQTSGQSEAMDSLQQQQNRLLAGKYLATVNFALNQKDLEVAPYLMLTEAYDINPKYMDTVYQALTPRVKESYYGKKLEAFIQGRTED
ncbi:DUF4369 domain-containing protein [Aureitalea marina]|uniref:DUF4369 domain-containing protein n=1 Tax=Aureitalea marina TaxID=930804 RepID=A0A2S7KQB2_9FLAO|nr:DUF4369 domain-containing protein [Aureitalea marina]PQB04800.1 hypothetical protein BST85_07735 [Aureitalea marina]